MSCSAKEISWMQALRDTPARTQQTTVTQLNASLGIDHFTVSCLVAWPLNESEARGDLLIETSLLFSC